MSELWAQGDSERKGDNKVKESLIILFSPATVKILISFLFDWVLCEFVLKAFLVILYPGEKSNMFWKAFPFGGIFDFFYDIFLIFLMSFLIASMFAIMNYYLNNPLNTAFCSFYIDFIKSCL